MCTVSIYQRNDTCILTMNRDESRQRPEAGVTHTDRTAQSPAGSYPLDSLSGGTWLGMSEAGFALCVLNRYDRRHFPGLLRSRGEIIPAALKSESISACIDYLTQLCTKNFAGFDLLLVDHRQCWLFSWDCEHYNISEIMLHPWYLHTSSSVYSEYCTKRRHDQFRLFTEQSKNRKAIPQDIITGLHLHQFFDDHSASILMAREKSHTKSITQVVLSKNTLLMNYFPLPSEMAERNMPYNLPQLKSETARYPAGL